MKSIFQQLQGLGLTSEDTRELYSTHTRDVDDLKVWRDTVSEVIYIDTFILEITPTKRELPSFAGRP